MEVARKWAVASERREKTAAVKVDPFFLGFDQKTKMKSTLRIWVNSIKGSNYDVRV